MAFVDILRRTDIFGDLNDQQLEMVSGICSEVHYGLGEMIFQEGSAGRELYVIVRGLVEIVVDPTVITAHRGEQRQVPITTMRAGQGFGEIALVDEGQRSAGARSAAEDTRLLQIPRDRLLNLCDQYPALGYRVMRNVAADLALKMRGADLTIREQLLRGQNRGQGDT
jgi:CRP-like cAMP-binding protein